MQDWDIVFWIIIAIGVATIPLMLIFDPTRRRKNLRDRPSKNTPTTAKPHSANGSS
jgi:predicted MFS family arabinose efflux permease